MPEDTPPMDATPPSDAVEAAPERRVAADMVRRGLLTSPVLILVCALGWGLGGLWSALVALGLVLGNFLAGAAIIAWAARISPNVLMAGVLGGYLLRLGVITAVVLPIRHAEWFDAVPFALVLLVLHVGLLVWELRHVSASLAHPGLRPGSGLFRSGARRRPARRSGRTPEAPAADTNAANTHDVRVMA